MHFGVIIYYFYCVCVYKNTVYVEYVYFRGTSLGVHRDQRRVFYVLLCLILLGQGVLLNLELG